ncbi:carboxypeptidase regulatory-like domain-containing protein [Limibacter armeniacum]|uniref:carboxypeptidase regulatory-like domain-containing protein n=1 Tax=Limibacter armeniacum TaxID=466084 RepID=UPI002FE518BF
MDKLTFLSFTFLLSFCMYSCSNDDPEPKENASIMVHLKADSPNPNNNIYLDIKEVWVRMENNDKEWISLDGASFIHNLNNTDQQPLVGYGSIPSGTIEQIKLSLGVANSIVVNDEEYKLNIPEELVFDTDERIESGKIYNIDLSTGSNNAVSINDFGIYNFHPTLSASSHPITGISGKLSTTSPAKILVYNQDAVEPITTTQTKSLGGFMVSDLAPGVYQLVVTAEGYADYTRTVLVSQEHVTNIATIELVPSR